MEVLKSLLRDVWDNGRTTRTRSGLVRRVFDRKVEFDLREGFPAVTTKLLFWKSMVGELLWFLNGRTDLASLRKYSELSETAWTIWTNDCKRWHSTPRDVAEDDLGELYGYQWRNHSMDQIARLVDGIKTDPTSRYLRVMAWNHDTICNDRTALPPCHIGFTVFIEDGYLDLKWSQRSVDTFLGLPFNIASYALLAHILGKLTGLTPRRLIGDLDDVHIYEDHVHAVREQLQCEPYPLPTVKLPDITCLEDLADLTASDFSLINYRHHPAISAPLSVG